MFSFVEKIFVTVRLSRDGIYPSWQCPIEIYEGAQHNLPDTSAMTTAERIEKMISETMCVDDILLVLISGKIIVHKKNEEFISNYFCS